MVKHRWFYLQHFNSETTDYILVGGSVLCQSFSRFSGATVSFWLIAHGLCQAILTPLALDVVSLDFPACSRVSTSFQLPYLFFIFVVFSMYSPGFSLTLYVAQRKFFRSLFTKTFVSFLCLPTHQLCNTMPNLYRSTDLISLISSIACPACSFLVNAASRALSTSHAYDALLYYIFNDISSGHSHETLWFFRFMFPYQKYHVL